MAAIDETPRVRILTGPRAGEVVRLVNQRSVYGRRADCDFVCSHTHVGREHSYVLRRQGGGCYVMGSGTSNGTYLRPDTAPVSLLQTESGWWMRVVGLTPLREGDEFGIPPECLVYQPAPLPPSRWPCRLDAQQILRWLRGRPEADAGRARLFVSECVARFGPAASLGELLDHPDPLEAASGLARFVIASATASDEPAFGRDRLAQAGDLERATCGMLRKAFGHACDGSVGPAVRAWGGGVVGRLAADAREATRPDGSFDPLRLGILADALQDAGCGDERLVEHLLEPGPHYPGCWAIDAVAPEEAAT